METPCRVFRNLSQMGNAKINAGNLIPTVSRQVLMSPVVEYTSVSRQYMLLLKQPSTEICPVIFILLMAFL